MGTPELRTSIAAARSAGADVVIVFPHWGLEFQAQPTASQRRFAKVAVIAGADMVLGGHSHWASAMEVINGKPVFYSMGNFIFDQNWSVETSQGLVIESTFIGSRLVSTRMLPTVILKQSQPNFVDIATDGVPIASLGVERLVLLQIHHGGSQANRFSPGEQRLSDGKVGILLFAFVRSVCCWSLVGQEARLALLGGDADCGHQAGIQ
ncbi:MAG: hypothetical protein DWI32_00810 [Candidatus Aquidulcis sp.]|nr:MAG: hypothetical protein DWI32_00810 [Candidatus Aquidulcis sp.]